MPDRELADAALVLIGGVLLITPGFVTDVFGFCFVLPFTRPVVRRGLAMYVGRRLRGGGPARRSPVRRPGDPGDGRVVPGEVIADDQPPAASGRPRRIPGPDDTDRRG